MLLNIGKLTEDRLEQLLKAYYIPSIPMLLNIGKLIEDRLEQLLKAFDIP